jgi:hypothetical protein
MKTCKNYLRNQKKRRNDPMIRQIHDGKITKKWEKLAKPTIHEHAEMPILTKSTPTPTGQMI